MMFEKNPVFHSLNDFRLQAKRRLPRIVFDFIDGGAGTELGLHRNQDALAQTTLLPRIGRDMSRVWRNVQWMGQDFDSPFGIAPLGLCGLVHPTADLTLAKAAQKFRIPYILSATASTAVEHIADHVGSAPWFQLYAPVSLPHLEQLVQRIDAVGCPVLVVTVDTAAFGRRLRDRRNRMSWPYRPDFASALNALKHPAWLSRYLAADKIGFPNLASPDAAIKSMSFPELMAWQTGGSLDWDTLRCLRDRWPRRLVLKGLSSAEDARQAIALGADAVVVSNHGGRQLDAAPATITQLPQFAASGIAREQLMFDSGIRSGEDILKALLAGAGMTFLGRPFLFALATAGMHGVECLINILNEELETAMRLCGIRLAANPADSN